jgi:hypothetical protein
MDTLNTPDADIEAEALPETIVPTDVTKVYLGGLFLLALLATC